MAPFSATTRKRHCLHPSHELEKVCFPNEYICNGCNSSGNGFRYRCHVNKSSDCINFNLHEFCANCPSRLTKKHFMHPDHILKLHTPNLSSFHGCLKICSSSNPARPPYGKDSSFVGELCESPIDDETQIFYACKRCHFHVHPLCSQLPHRANHRIADRELTLDKPVEDGRCAVCREVCSGWRYSCGGVDIHIKCITSDTNDRRSRLNIFQILKSLGVAVFSIVVTSAGGPGPAVGAVVGAVAQNQ